MKGTNNRRRRLDPFWVAVASLVGGLIALGIVGSTLTAAGI